MCVAVVFFPLLPSPKRLEPHIGPLLSTDFIASCSGLLRKIGSNLRKFHYFPSRFAHQSIEKTFRDRFRSRCQAIRSILPEKNASNHDEQDENWCIFARIWIILWNWEKISSLNFRRADRVKCLLSNDHFRSPKLVQTRGQFWQKAEDLVNKMGIDTMKRRDGTMMYCYRTSTLLMLPVIQRLRRW